MELNACQINSHDTEISGGFLVLTILLCSHYYPSITSDPPVQRRLCNEGGFKGGVRAKQQSLTGSSSWVWWAKFNRNYGNVSPSSPLSSIVHLNHLHHHHLFVVKIHSFNPASHHKCQQEKNNASRKDG